MVGFHRKASLLYCRVYNLTLSLKRNISWKGAPFACQSFLDWNRVHFPLKTIETKNNDFQVQNLFWGPPWHFWFFRGVFPGQPRSFAAKNISVSPISWIVWRCNEIRRLAEHLAGCRWERSFFFPHYCDWLFMGSGHILGWLLKLDLYS